jgi:hypothetical protein
MDRIALCDRRDIFAIPRNELVRAARIASDRMVRVLSRSFLRMMVMVWYGDGIT